RFAFGLVLVHGRDPRPRLSLRKQSRLESLAETATNKQTNERANARTHVNAIFQFRRAEREKQDPREHNETNRAAKLNCTAQAHARAHLRAIAISAGGWAWLQPSADGCPSGADGEHSPESKCSPPAPAWLPWAAANSAGPRGRAADKMSPRRTAAGPSPATAAGLLIAAADQGLRMQPKKAALGWIAAGGGRRLPGRKTAARVRPGAAMQPFVHSTNRDSSSRRSSWATHTHTHTRVRARACRVPPKAQARPPEASASKDEREDAQAKRGLAPAIGRSRRTPIESGHWRRLIARRPSFREQPHRPGPWPPRVSLTRACTLPAKSRWCSSDRARERTRHGPTQLSGRRHGLGCEQILLPAGPARLQRHGVSSPGPHSEGDRRGEKSPPVRKWTRAVREKLELTRLPRPPPPTRIKRTRLGKSRRKTSILNRFLFKKFEEKHRPTVEDLFTKEFDLGSIEIKVSERTLCLYFSRRSAGGRAGKQTSRQTDDRAGAPTFPGRELGRVGKLGKLARGRLGALRRSYRDSRTGLAFGLDENRPDGARHQTRRRANAFDGLIPGSLLLFCFAIRARLGPARGSPSGDYAANFWPNFGPTSECRLLASSERFAPRDIRPTRRAQPSTAEAPTRPPGLNASESALVLRHPARSPLARVVRSLADGGADRDPLARTPPGTEVALCDASSRGCMRACAPGPERWAARTNLWSRRRRQAR
ncbi:Hypothetical predicted protein, partial [Olea europaea subsp. europaea]